VVFEEKDLEGMVKMDEKWKIFIITTIITVAIVLSIAAGVWFTINPMEEKCLVWQRVDAKGQITQELFLNESSLVIPVYADTYDWVKAGQSYNFYCSRYWWKPWICSASYECSEMHWEN
jgi:hypothetical protein